jgi:hypothetical protein
MQRYLVILAFLVSFFNLSGQNGLAIAQTATMPPTVNTLLGSTRPLPILAWSGLPPSLSTVERFKEVREAGFTHHLQVYGTMELLQKVLDAAGQADVKIFTNTIGPLEEFVPRVKNHPAFAGYLVGVFDEASAEGFDALAKEVKAVQALDPEHGCYVNLLPTYGCKSIKLYQDYITSFLEKVPVKVLSFDHYPIFLEIIKETAPKKDYVVTRIRPDFYENLEIIRRASEKAKLPFWAFALSVGHWGYPIATLPHLRFQVYSNLAYGAQGIEYFTYMTLTDPNVDWNNGPIDRDGKRTVVYDRVKLVNSEIQALAGVFLGSKVIAVSHTGETIPTGTTRYQVKPPFRSLTTTGPGAVVAELEKGQHRFLVVVNRDIEKPMTLTLAQQPGTKLVEIQKNGTLSPIAADPARYEIEPGDVKIVMWSAPYSN